MMNKQRSQSPPIPQTGFVKILHSLIIISLLLMMTSGLQIYNATPVFGGKTGWQVPKWATLGGWLAGGRDWHFTVMWVFSYFSDSAMEKAIFFSTRSQGITSRTKSETTDICLAPSDIYQYYPDPDPGDRIWFGNVSTRSITLAI